MKVGDFLLPCAQYPDDYYRIVGLDATEARLQALNFGRDGGRRWIFPLSELSSRYALVTCKNCGENPATVLHGRTLNEQERAENRAWSDSFKDKDGKPQWHTGHCPHLELPQGPWCQDCHEQNPV